ncbi:MAG: ribosome small subunit-dependent GTPase A [Dokdonella sp.]|uniref:ribosome small subunit-dependent GTPase A n=1 Tax=Dokdonella sp. TaxID=2291710 RepID=UPI0025C6C332|nr:ribosome small subunit-dependent GTPase A [Dokdonella sp.]MBZ0223008.1 ribosome small subunit-dependent GTPase A [Dokdonella sp.]MCC7254967.1 ribosome small subunit-dependent GTPase A [Dokdonella sp.]
MQTAPDDAPRLARIGWRAAVPVAGIELPNRLARVVAQHRAGYELHDGDDTFNAQPAARFLRRDVDPVDRPAVGDFVVVAPGKPPTIEAILPRSSEFKRGAAGESHRRQVIAANIDSVFVLMGLDGDFNPARIERYLLLIEDSGAQAVVVLTKADRSEDAAAALVQMQERLGPAARVFAVNAKSADSIAPLLQWLGPGSSTVLVGSSGAGKSTLTNTLLGEARQATGAVRDRDSRGRHTTTHRALLMLPSGGCLIDTPGMRELKLTGGEELDEGQFADIDTLAQSCRFGDCAHLSEPGCAVRAALEDGSLDADRWRNYCKLRDELAATADALEAQMRRKGEAKVLTKALNRRLGEKYGRS